MQHYFYNKALRYKRLSLAIGISLSTTAIPVAGGQEASLELSSLDGDNGFVINGMNTTDFSGNSVSTAGDINGDGINDVIIGASAASANGAGSGESYVVFGQNGGFAASLELADLDGSNGFVINGVEAADASGYSVSAAGDVNGDGIDDVIIGSYATGPNGMNRDESYVVFGQNGGFSASLELSSLNGVNGFVINGVSAGGPSGGSVVSNAGDVNGDGVDDVIIGAYRTNPNGSFSGTGYVVFGRQGVVSANFDVSNLDGTNGFIINGLNANDSVGRSVSTAGDINGDDIDDLILGASGASPNANVTGVSYVVFGQNSGFAASLDLSGLDGSNGFVIVGADAFSQTGRSVGAAGDINGDNIDDVIIGASFAAPSGTATGAAYVVFGQSGGFAASLDLSALNGSNGFVVTGVDENDQAGRSVSTAGDINGDGIDDVIIGAYDADPNGSSSGESYVVFGRNGGFTASVALSDLDGSNGFVLNGINTGDLSGFSVSTAGDMNHDRIDDLIIGATFADPNGSFSGESYVVFGSSDRVFMDGFEQSTR